MKLFDLFPNEFFDGSSQMKKDFSKELCSSLNPDQLLISARAEINSLINNANISDFSKEFCLRCFDKAPDEFFILPSSTTGKYHGGRTSLENCIGGNIIHTKNVLAMSDRVLHRYKGLIIDDRLGELLKVSCLLHDICKVPSGEVYTKDTHGEDGADLIKYVFDTFDPDVVPSEDYIGIITHAVANHMYLWKFQNVWSQVANTDLNSNLSYLLVGLMLSECDYYAI